MCRTCLAKGGSWAIIRASMREAPFDPHCHTWIHTCVAANIVSVEVISDCRTRQRFCLEAMNSVRSRTSVLSLLGLFLSRFSGRPRSVVA